MSNRKKNKKQEQDEQKELFNKGQLGMDFEGESPDGVEFPATPEEAVVPESEFQVLGTLMAEEESVVTPVKELSFAERVARTCHEVNRAYCEGHGDFTQVPWDEAPRWAHESAMQGVKFFVDNPYASASAMHDNWCAQKIEDGWKYGEEKDPIKKTHPCLVSYRDLPFRQQVKDILFMTVVRSFVSPV